MISLSFCVKFDVDCLLMFVKIKKELFIEKIGICLECGI